MASMHVARFALQEAIPYFSDKEGLVINIASVVAVKGMPPGAYGASSMRSGMSSSGQGSTADGIRIHVLCPGRGDTHWSARHGQTLTSRF